MLKKLISLFIFLLTIQLVLADDINIDLIQYDTSLNIARIQISNKGETTYYNVSISIDDMPSKFIVERLRPKAAIIKTEVVSPTKHTITVSTNEKTFSKELHFAKSEDIVEKELKQIEEERNMTKQYPKIKRKKPILSRTAKQSIFLIIFLFIIILVILFTKKRISKPKFRKPTTRIPIQKPFAPPLRRPTLPPKMLRKRIQEREKERERILQSLTPSKKEEPIKTYKKEQKIPEKKIVKREIPKQEILKEQPKQRLPKGKREEPDILKKLRGISKEK